MYIVCMKSPTMRLLYTAVAILFNLSMFGQISFPSGSKILCLGDSRVEGSETYDSYRYEFWKDLIDCDWNFDFVGSEIDPILYPTYQNFIFDLYCDWSGRRYVGSMDFFGCHDFGFGIPKYDWLDATLSQS